MKLETDSQWMKESLDEIRLYSKEIAGYAHQLVDLSRQTAAVSDAMGRAFHEIEKERAERKEEIKQVWTDISPVLKGWDGVAETSRWVKAGVIGVFALVFISVLIIVLHLQT